MSTFKTPICNIQIMATEANLCLCLAVLYKLSIYLFYIPAYDGLDQVQCYITFSCSMQLTTLSDLFIQRIIAHSVANSGLKTDKRQSFILFINIKTLSSAKLKCFLTSKPGPGITILT